MLNAQELTRVAQVALAAPSLRAAAGELRKLFPQLRTTVVEPEDMKGEEPAVHLGECDLYLMASDGHCWTVTRDPAEAVGIVLTPPRR